MYDGFFDTPASMPLLSNAPTRSISAWKPDRREGKQARWQRREPAENPRAIWARAGRSRPASAFPPVKPSFWPTSKGPGAIPEHRGWPEMWGTTTAFCALHWEDQEIPERAEPSLRTLACGWYDNSGMPLKGPFSLRHSMMVCAESQPRAELLLGHALPKSAAGSPRKTARSDPHVLSPTSRSTMFARSFPTRSATSTHSSAA